MSREEAGNQPASTADAMEEEVISGVTIELSSEGKGDKPGPSEPQTIAEAELVQDPIESESKTAAAEAAVASPSTVRSELPDQGIVINDSGTRAEATITIGNSPDPSNSAAPNEVVSYSTNAEESRGTEEESNTDAAGDQDDTDFVPPDMEHIVSTGATQDGASSMQALRELVAQARASAGQPREALPPGFGDDDEEAEASFPSANQAQRGEKRKAEAELEELVKVSAGIDEVKAAAEKSQHPETKTLLQKALSSISGLVSRRPKADPAAAPLPTQTEKQKLDSGEADRSDDSDSSSNEGSSSSDSSDDEDGDVGGDDDCRIGLADGGDDDDEEEGGGPSGSMAPATKNEILAPDVEQPPFHEVTDAERQTLRKLGKVHSIVDSVVVVEQDVQQTQQSYLSTAGSIPVDSTGRQGEREGEYSVLDTGSLLCFEDGKVLGLVFETFGSIHNPLYSIRFASAAVIDRDSVVTGKAVFYLPAQSTYVLTQLLRSMKGSDASNMWDEEVAEDEIDYSDDEQEAEAKRRAKAVRSGKVDDHGNPIGPASSRGNKRQKQGAGQSSQPPYNSVHGSFNQRPGQVGARNTSSVPGQQSFHNHSNGNAPASLPRRNVGGASMTLPLAPAGPASLGPAFPYGIASLPPKPSAGLPSKPNFQPEATSSSNRPAAEPSNISITPDSQTAIAPSSRMSTAEGNPSGPGHGRMHSAAANNLPAKPVDAAAAAAAAMAPSTSLTGTAASPYRAHAGVVGISSPPHPSRSATIGRAAPAPVGAYLHQGSPGWYAGSGSAPSSTPASPAALSQHAAPRGTAYSPGAGAPAAQGGHYNPAYAAHWQQHFAPGSTPAPSAHSAWNAAQAYHPSPLHMAPGAMSQQAYGGYGGQHGGYGAPSGAPWNGQTYPGSHYPGYADASASSQKHYHGAAANTASGHANQGHYNPSAQAYGYGAYPGQTSSSDAYNAYGYGAPGMHASAAAAPPAQDSYDPRSPSMSSSNNQNQHVAGSQGR